MSKTGLRFTAFTVFFLLGMMNLTLSWSRSRYRVQLRSPCLACFYHWWENLAVVAGWQCRTSARARHQRGHSSVLAAASTWCPAFCSAAPGISPRERALCASQVKMGPLMFYLKKGSRSKWCIQTNLKFQAHLINEWGKAVVETFDLLFFLLADGMDTRVDVYVDWRQQALVDSHSCDRHCVTSPMAHPGDGVGSHGHAAEGPCRWIKSWAAAALAPQTHDCPVSRFRFWGGMKGSGGCCGAVYFSLYVGSLFIDRWGCGVIAKLCGLPMWVNQSDTCHLLSHLPPFLFYKCSIVPALVVEFRLVLQLQAFLKLW